MRFQPRTALIYAVLILAIALPRLLALDRFVTVDEPKWLARAGNFYLALARGDLENTFTREHPGVTVTWAGTVGLLWRFPEYKSTASGYLTDSRQVEPLIREGGLEPIRVLEAARVIMVLVVTAALVGSFWTATQLIGIWPSILGFLLIAFDPFYLGLSRLLHLDGLMSTLLLLSLLAFLNYLRPRGSYKKANLLISALAAGLAWLTKSPAIFLIPFIGLLLLLDLVRGWYLDRHVSLKEAWNRVPTFLLWAGIGALVFVLLWPAMWVNPAVALQQVFAEATTYAEGGHTSDVFFRGAVISGDSQRTFSAQEQTLYGPWSQVRVNGDEGRSFYLIAYLWRTTPVVLLGLILAAVVLLIRGKSDDARQVRWPVVALALFAGLFALFMTLGSKKFDRYLLPVFLPLDLVAATGWVMAARWVSVRLTSGMARLAVSVTSVAVILIQVIGAMQTYPYYLSYYNPLLGGGEVAPRVMMIGWGEGLDQAARYLNAQPGAGELRVMSWYPDGPFSYIFDGQTVHASSEWEPTREKIFESDYVVLYIHQWQRQLPFSEMLAYFSGRTPEHVIRLDGIEYAQIYRMQDAAQR